MDHKRIGDARVVIDGDDCTEPPALIAWLLVLLTVTTAIATINFFLPDDKRKAETTACRPPVDQGEVLVAGLVEDNGVLKLECAYWPRGIYRRTKT